MTISENVGLPEVRVYLGEMPSRFCENRYREQWYTSEHRGSNGQPSLTIFRAIIDGEESFRMAYEDGTNIIMAGDGSAIWAAWPPEFTLEDAATYLLGPVMAFFAHLRQRTCLHASAVVVHGRALVLIGAAGSGKSTSAAAFAQAGYAVLADDVVVLDERDGEFIAQPACPNVRLWPPAVEALFGRPDALPPLTPNWDKCGLDLAQPAYAFQAEPIPVAGLYVLGRRVTGASSPTLTRIPGKAGLLMLACHSWGLPDQPHVLARALQLFARILSRVPMSEAAAHEDPRRLREFCELLASDAMQLPLARV